MAILDYLDRGVKSVLLYVHLVLQSEGHLFPHKPSRQKSWGIRWLESAVIIIVITSEYVPFHSAREIMTETLKVRKVGNSSGVILPKSLLEEMGVEEGVELLVPCSAQVN